MRFGATSRNVVANLFGGAWNALLSMLFVQLYLRFLGSEAFGLVGVLGLPGATVPANGMELRVSAIRGVESNGMMC